MVVHFVTTRLIPAAATLGVAVTVYCSNAAAFFPPIPDPPGRVDTDPPRSPDRPFPSVPPVPTPWPEPPPAAPAAPAEAG